MINAKIRCEDNTFIKKFRFKIRCEGNTFIKKSRQKIEPLHDNAGAFVLLLRGNYENNKTF